MQNARKDNDPYPVTRGDRKEQKPNIFLQRAGKTGMGPGNGRAHERRAYRAWISKAGEGMIDVQNYNDNRGIYSPLVEHNDCVCGYWLTGNDYRGNGYYGGYPPNYLKRIRLLSPHAIRVLHLFSGKVTKGLWPDEWTCDINPDIPADCHRNAESISEYPMGQFDLVLADPPYEQNHIKYGTKPVNKRRVIKECAKIIPVGGCLVWLDTRIPMWSKADGWKLRGTIGLNQSTQHLTRTITILEKVLKA